MSFKDVVAKRFYAKFVRKSKNYFLKLKKKLKVSLFIYLLSETKNKSFWWLCVLHSTWVSIYQLDISSLKKKKKSFKNKV